MGTPRIVPPERPTQHPTVALELSEADLRFGDDKCDLYVLLQLPPALFLDPYQLATTVSTTVPSTPLSPPAAYASVDIFGQAAPASDMRQPIELEKAVGWTDPDGARRRHAQAQSRPRQHHHHHHHAASYTRSTHMAPARSAGLEKEFTLNVLRIGVSSGTDAGERSFNTTHMLDLPLQARYLPPLPSRPPSTWRGWWNVLRLRNYDRVQLPKPQLMYSCLDDGGPEIAKDEWEYSVKSAVLAPEWALLSPHLNPLSNKERDLLVFSDPEGCTRPWSLRLPRGDQSVYEPVQLITLAASALASLWIVISILTTSFGARRKEAELTRACLAAVKSQ